MNPKGARFLIVEIESKRCQVPNRRNRNLALGKNEAKIFLQVFIFFGLKAYQGVELCVSTSGLFLKINETK